VAMVSLGVLAFRPLAEGCKASWLIHLGMPQHRKATYIDIFIKISPF
jgi:hypothetical protein